MTLMNMFTHIHKVTYLYATPEAEPRGILLIKSKSHFGKILEGHWVQVKKYSRVKVIPLGIIFG